MKTSICVFKRGKLIKRFEADEPRIMERISDPFGFRNAAPIVPYLDGDEEHAIPGEFEYRIVFNEGAACEYVLAEVQFIDGKPVGIDYYMSAWSDWHTLRVEFLELMSVLGKPMINLKTMTEIGLFEAERVE